MDEKKKGDLTDSSFFCKQNIERNTHLDLETEYDIGNCEKHGVSEPKRQPLTHSLITQKKTDYWYAEEQNGNQVNIDGKLLYVWKGLEFKRECRSLCKITIYLLLSYSSLNKELC